MIDLRPHQDRGLRAASLAYQEGARSVLLVLPTGGGKTIMAAYAARAHLNAGPDRRVLWCCHRQELVEQAEWTLAILGADPHRITIGTVQSLLRQPHVPATMVVLDEARHYVADEWTRILDGYRDARILGLDATPERQDGIGLGAIFDRLLVVAQPGELVDAGVLVECDVLRPARPLEPGQIAQDPVEAYLAHAPGEQALLFARSVEDSYKYAAALVSRGVRAECVNAATPPEERARRVKLFRDGLLAVLTNVQVLTEGFDAPAASCCVLARGCSSTGAYLQMVGRVLRAAPGKSRAKVLDLRGVSHEHGHPLADREYSLEGRAIREAGYQGEACRTCNSIPCTCPEGGPGTQLRVVDVPLESWQDRLARAPVTVHVRLLAQWMRTARERGYKMGWALHRFRGATRKMATPALIRAALEVSRA